MVQGESIELGVRSLASDASCIAVTSGDFKQVIRQLSASVSSSVEWVESSRKSSHHKRECDGGIKRSGSGTRLPGFKSQLCLLLNLCNMVAF